MYWKFGTAVISAPTFPLHVIGTAIDKTFTLVTEAGEELTNAYLFTPLAEKAGMLRAKLSSESTYKNIQGPFDATCYLGNISASTETDIDIRIDFQTGATEGYTIIPILVGHNDAARLPHNSWEGSWIAVWEDEWVASWENEW